MATCCHWGQGWGRAQCFGQPQRTVAAHLLAGCSGRPGSPLPLCHVPAVPMATRCLWHQVYISALALAHQDVLDWGCSRVPQNSETHTHTHTPHLSPAAGWSQQRSPLTCPPGVLVAEPAVISPGMKTSPLALAVKLSAWVVPCCWLVMLTAAESAPAPFTAPAFTADQSLWAGPPVPRAASTSLNWPAKSQQWGRKGWGFAAFRCCKLALGASLKEGWTWAGRMMELVYGSDVLQLDRGSRLWHLPPPRPEEPPNTQEHPKGTAEGEGHGVNSAYGSTGASPLSPAACDHHSWALCTQRVWGVTQSPALASQHPVLHPSLALHSSRAQSPAVLSVEQAAGGAVSTAPARLAQPGSAAPCEPSAWVLRAQAPAPPAVRGVTGQGERRCRCLSCVGTPRLLRLRSKPRAKGQKPPAAAASPGCTVPAARGLSPAGHSCQVISYQEQAENKV